MNPTLVLFEDQYVDRLRPINLARPTFAVTCGAFSLATAVSKWGWPIQTRVRSYLRRVVDAEGIHLTRPLDGPLLYLNAALSPDLGVLGRIKRMVEEKQPFVALSHQRITAAFVPGPYNPTALSQADLPTFLLEQRLPVVEDEFATFEHPFDVVKHHERLLPQHLEHLLDRGTHRPIDKDVYVGEDAEVASNVVFDASDGPIVVGDRVKIRPFAYLAGPLKIYDNCLIIDHAAIKHGTVLGHTCKAGGEIEVSIIEPYSNKQHHGFLGHAYVGSWVNLGAGTSNSDLKNTYGEIGIEVDGKPCGTGMQFAGCVVGDHTKTAINTSIFTGKLIGVASFVYGFVTTNVPSFTNYARSFGQVTEVGVDVAVKTQRRMARRRKVEMSSVESALMEDLFELTRGERQLSSEQVVL
jgi:UDP-N-acetylglucosamine diphosphorylase / glucose-1-phosphate thymidylyltransferase / UDP-N-acetylgalactosamine diphosphorylase / glucosamine-1-phosphate N-acetyltransferase / galactosamine-1-phosphate N-acetyltransferase